MKALVLGGTGFIGAAACKELMRRGVETVAASRTQHPYGTFTSHLAFDRCDEGELAAALESIQPDVLLDLAGFQPAEVAVVMRHFRGQRYVFVSTSVYPELHGRPAREEDFVPLDGEFPAGQGRPGSRLDYFSGKRWCETLLARTPSFASAVLRPPAVFGPDDPSLRIAAYLQRVEDGGPLLVPAESYRRQLGVAWVRDVGYACALACDLKRPLAGAYNVALDGVSLEDLIRGIGRAFGRDPQLVPMPWSDLPAGASPYGPDPAWPAGYDLARARRELGFEASALEDALADTLHWFLARRPSHDGYKGRAEELQIADRVVRS